MKINIKIMLLSLVAASSVFLSSCYKEPDLLSELAVSQGKVAQISIVWLGTTRTTAASTAVITGATVVAGSTTNCNIEFTSLVPVKEFKVYWAATATGTQTLVATVPAGGQKYDANLRQYTISVPITAQETKGTTRVFFAEIISENGLASAKKSAILTTSK